MTEEDLQAIEIMTRAYKESKGETVDLVVLHELRGITVERLNWFFPNAGKYYKLWHPRDHISWTWEIPPTPEKRGGAIHISSQRFGKSPVHKLRMRIEDPQNSPFGTNDGWSTFLSDNNEPVACATHNWKSKSYGSLMQSTFRFPAMIPQWFIDAVRQHNKEEMSELCNFLPNLYKRNLKTTGISA